MTVTRPVAFVPYPGPLYGTTYQWQVDQLPRLVGWLADRDMPPGRRWRFYTTPEIGELVPLVIGPPPCSPAVASRPAQLLGESVLVWPTCHHAMAATERSLDGVDEVALLDASRRLQRWCDYLTKMPDKPDKPGGTSRGLAIVGPNGTEIVDWSCPSG